MSDNSPTTLAFVRFIQDLWRAGKSDSLVDYTRESRVEPKLLIATDVLYNDMLPDVSQTLLSLVAGYYLQAVALSVNVGKIEVHRTLAKLNPNRSVSNDAADSLGWLMAQENYKHRLPTFEAKAALEAISTRVPEVNTFSVARDTHF